MDIQAVLVESLQQPGAPVIGPFVVHLDATSDVAGRNYAAPFVAETPTAQDIAALVALMLAHSRLPRLEFVVPNPGLEEALTAAGFAVTSRVALMTLDGFAPTQAPPGVRVTTEPTDGELLGAGAVQNTAYRDPEEPAVAARRLRHNLDCGGFVAVALAGAAVGTGLATPPVRGACEIAAVAVDAAHRRRGIGAAVASALTQAVLDAGHHPLLQAEAGEVSLYERIGFVRAGELVYAELA